MTLAIALLLPLLAYAALWFSLAHRPHLPPIAAAFACIWMLVATTITALYHGNWTRSTQVAWTGMREAPEAATGSLLIGGSRETDLVGWPNGAFQPRVAIQAARTTDTAVLDVSGGSAFIISSDMQHVVNGRVLPPGTPVEINGYQFQNIDPLLRGRHVRVARADGRVVADFPLSKRDFNRFFGLDYLSSLSDPEDVESFAPFDNWARSVLVAATADDEIKLLDRDYASRMTCTLPCMLDVRWRQMLQRLSIQRDALGALSVQFERPWKRTSPIPPKQTGLPWQLVITRHPEPGDYAFVMPLGAGVADPRAVLMLDDSRGGVRLLGGGADTAPSATAARNPVVTSARGIRIGRTIQEFVTSVDVLSPGAVVLSLAIALLTVFLGVALTLPVCTPPQQWLLYGVVSTAWSLLVLRVALAVRYAGAPELLDRLAVSGIRISLVSAAIVPGILLLTVYLRAEQYGGRHVKIRGPAARWAAAYLVLLVAVAMFEWTAPARVFPQLPSAVTPPSFGLIGWVGLLAVVAYYLVSIRAVATVQREPLLPLPFYRIVATRVGRDFWNGITSAQRLRDIVPLAALTAIALIGLPLLLRLAATLLRGTKFVQEVITPVVFTLVPALLWLSAAVHFQRKSNQRRGWWWLVAAVAALVTLSIPIVLTPVAISDPGSMLATSAMFLPLALILLLSDRGRSAGIFVGAFFILSIAGTIALCFNVETILPLGKKAGTGNVPARLYVFARTPQVPQEILRRSASLEDAYEHTWENRAIAHEGGWNGLGFGNAPNRRSRIGQQTLQADSVFSFFIVGDYGMIGGIALLLVYAMPVLFFIWHTRSDTQLAPAFGLVVAAGFFLEAAAHAAMNLGILPFAGRNLPLLAANSVTDALKWACLLTIAAQTVFWSLPTESISATAVRTRPAIFSPRAQPWSRVLLTGLAAFVVVSVAIVGGRIVRNSAFGEPFTWDSVLATVQQLADSGELTVDGHSQVVLRHPQAIGESSLLLRELHAFNQLGIDDKLGEPPPGQLAARLFSVRTVPQFNAALRDEAAVQLDAPRGRPPLFRLIELPKYADEAGQIPIVNESHRVIPNQLFNVRISFRTAPSTQLPVVEWSARRWGTFVLRGNGYSIEVPRRPALPHELRIIDLARTSDETMSIVADRNSDAPRGEIWLRVPIGRTVRRKLFVRFAVENDALYLDDPPGGFRLRIGRGGSDVRVLPRDHVRLASGDTVRIPVDIGVQPQFDVEERPAMPLIGPAWVGGSWRLASDSMSPFPWTAYLRDALAAEWERLTPAAAAQRYRSLTIEQDLQTAAQGDVARIARELHATRLATFGAAVGRYHRATGQLLRRGLELAMPPRVALAMLRVPTGEVLALAGSPRMSAGDLGGPCDGGSFCPPHAWIDESAPSSVRVRFGSDRNFDAIEVGSSTKPIFAAAALSVHPDLDRRLHVAGPLEMETDVFGMHITDKGWLARVSPRWTDFRRYLSQSDNRYHVRLGFLALAEGTPAGVAVGGVSASDRESMDGAVPWHRVPKFPARMLLSPSNPKSMQRIDDAPFAQALRSMFNIGVRQGDFLPRRYSFWTGNEVDDLPADRRPAPTTNNPGAAAPVATHPSHAFDVLSPETPLLALDYIREPRQYVSLLLGGNENRWANVDFAAAFATAVTGHPVVAHILPSVTVAPLSSRRAFPAIATHLRPGLEAVVTEGTARTVRDRLVPPELRAIGDLKVYAKTGTLAVEEGHATTSRLAIAFIRWQNEPAGIVKKGVVLSMVAEHAQLGDAARWLADYITENADAISRELR